MEENFIQVPTSISRNKGVSNEGKMVYLALQIVKQLRVNRIHMTLSCLMDMCGYYYGKSQNRQLFKDVISELVGFKIIKTYKDFLLTVPINVQEIKPTDVFYIEYNDGFLFTDEFKEQFSEGEIDDSRFAGTKITFTKIFYDKVIELLATEEKNKTGLISCYLMLMSNSIVSDTSIGVNSEDVETIAEYSNVNSRVFTRSIIPKLMDMKLVFEMTVKKVGQNGVYNKNFYCRWEHAYSAIRDMMDDDYYRNSKFTKIGAYNVENDNLRMIMNKIVENKSEAKGQDVIEKYIDKIRIS